MIELNWRYCKPVSGKNVLVSFAQEGFSLPSDYCECAEKNNGGRPDRQVLNVGGMKLSFRRLLRIDDSDSENVKAVFDSLKDSVPGIVPFGDDSFGNYFCFSWAENKDQPAVCFLDHETKEVTHVAANFGEFLALLGP
jgi:hypothetical protein